MGVSRRADIAMTEAEVRAFLLEQRWAVIGTIGPRGWPHVVTMGFAMVDDHVVFQTYRKSQKFVNLQRDPRITCLVEDPSEGYDQIRGVQIVGRAEILDAERTLDVLERTTAHSAQREGDPKFASEGTVAAVTEIATAKRAAVRILPERVLSWDHRRLDGRY